MSRSSSCVFSSPQWGRLLPPGPTPRRAPWALLWMGVILLVPAVATAGENKQGADSEAAAKARQDALLKKHFPLEEDIGPVPVVRVPKNEESKTASRPERGKPVRRKETGGSRVARPGSAVPDKLDETAFAPEKKAAEPEAAPVEGEPLGAETNQHIDDLVTRALTDPHPEAPAEPEQPAAARPPLGKAAIKKSMLRVQPLVRRHCNLGYPGVVLVRVEVAPAGKVARVTPEGALAHQPPAACVVERVKRARFPKSGGGSFQYAFSVR